jgi:hypothetical protein
MFQASAKKWKTWGTVRTGLTGVCFSRAAAGGALRLTAPEACWRALRGVCLGVATRDVSQLADPSRKLARDEARAVVEKLGLLGTVRRRGVSGTNIGVRNSPRRKQQHATEQNHDTKPWAA